MIVIYIGNNIMIQLAAAETLESSRYSAEVARMGSQRRDADACTIQGDNRGHRQMYCELSTWITYRVSCNDPSRVPSVGGNVASGVGVTRLTTPNVWPPRH